MLFLVLFGTLAVGFYGMSNASLQVSANDEHVTRAFLAAESGMDFMRHKLATVTIPPTTSSDQVLAALFADLKATLDDTNNLPSNISLTNNTISIPGSSSGRIKLDSKGHSTFRATITDWAGEIVVKVDGYYAEPNGAVRSITMDFTRQERATSAFDFAVASKGQIVMKKGAVTSVAGVDPKIAKMLSTKDSAGSITVTGGSIGGDLAIVSGGSASITGGTVSGVSTASAILADHVFEVTPPEFPTVDPTQFRKYATTNYVDGAKTQKNIIVKANTNPKFNANDTVQGIMYIESPNQVIFNGNFKLQGFIVMESSSSTTDLLTFKGNLTMSPLPSGSQFDALRATNGVAILAPNSAVHMTGSSGGNAVGNIIIKTFEFQGAADLTIDQGTLMTLHEGNNSAVFNGSKSVKFAATGANNQPTIGLSYSTYYSPKPSTYQEVAP